MTAFNFEKGASASLLGRIVVRLARMFRDERASGAGAKLEPISDIVLRAGREPRAPE